MLLLMAMWLEFSHYSLKLIRTLTNIAELNTSASIDAVAYMRDHHDESYEPKLITEE